MSKLTFKEQKVQEIFSDIAGLSGDSPKIPIPDRLAKSLASMHRWQVEALVHAITSLGAAVELNLYDRITEAYKTTKDN